jgi:hypothetical protein
MRGRSSGFRKLATSLARIQPVALAVFTSIQPFAGSLEVRIPSGKETT